MNAFLSFHPAALLVYFLSVFLSVFFTTNPIVTGIALLFAAVFAILLDREKALPKRLPLFLLFILLILLVNPLISHNGVTALFFINDNAITLEAFLYGGWLALLILAAALWFFCFHRVLTGEKTIYLFGKVSPKTALVMTSALRFMPRVGALGEKMRAASQSLGAYETKSLPQKLSATGRTFSALTSRSVENAVETGMAMNARGYRLSGRTQYAKWRFGKRDLALLLAVLALDGLFFTALGLGRLSFRFYPVIELAAPGILGILGYAAFFLLMILPTAITLTEYIKWRSYK